MSCSEEKIKMKQIYVAFKQYIAENQHFDILFSKKFGYIMATYEEWEPFVRICCAEDLLKELFSEIVEEVVLELDQAHGADYSCKLSEYEKKECRQKISPYLDNIENNTELWTLFEEFLNYY